MRRGYYLIPSLFTVANIFCGFLSIIASSRGQFERSAVLILVAIFADQVAPYHPLEADFGALRQPPSPAHWLGTDNLGRDYLSRLIYGSRVSLLIGLSVMLIAGLIGTTLGLLAGYFGGNPRRPLKRPGAEAEKELKTLLQRLTAAADARPGASKETLSS